MTGNLPGTTLSLVTMRAGMWAGGETRLTAPVGQESPGNKGACFGDFSPSIVGYRNDRLFYRFYVFIGFTFFLSIQYSNIPSFHSFPLSRVTMSGRLEPGEQGD